MSKLRSNPYVYPHAPFKHLSNNKRAGKIDSYIIKKEKISLAGIRKIIKSIHRDPIIPRDRKIEERIFSIFLNRNVLFGPQEFVAGNRSFWLDKISHFTSQKQKIQFTLLGFPFKIPVPLKTNRAYPDMGEVLILLQLSRIVQTIKKIYDPGAEIIIFTEGGLGRFVGVSKKEAYNYKKFLSFLNEKLGFSKSIIIRELSGMEKYKNFESTYKRNVSQLKNKFKSKDPEILKKYAGAASSISRIVNTKKIGEKVLMDVYNKSISDKEASKKVIQVRNYIERKLPASVFGYFAYLKTRDDLDYLSKKVPHYLALSVSPKKGRLGIIPVNTRCDKLPYHAVPIFIPKEKIFYLDYLVDIKHGNNKYIAVNLGEDKEKLPFYYILVE